MWNFHMKLNKLQFYVKFMLKFACVSLPYTCSRVTNGCSCYLFLKWRKNSLYHFRIIPAFTIKDIYENLYNNYLYIFISYVMRKTQGQKGEINWRHHQNVLFYDNIKCLEKTFTWGCFHCHLNACVKTLCWCLRFMSLCLALWPSTLFMWLCCFVIYVN